MYTGSNSQCGPHLFPQIQKYPFNTVFNDTNYFNKNPAIQKESFFGQFCNVPTATSAIKANPFEEELVKERYHSICVVDRYLNKSQDELRWEYFQSKKVSAPIQILPTPPTLAQFAPFTKPLCLTTREINPNESVLKYNPINKTSFGNGQYAASTNNNLPHFFSFNQNSRKENTVREHSPGPINPLTHPLFQNIQTEKRIPASTPKPANLNGFPFQITQPTTEKPTCSCNNVQNLQPSLVLSESRNEEFCQLVQNVFQPFPRQEFLNKVECQAKKDENEYSLKHLLSSCTMNDNKHTDDFKLVRFTGAEMNASLKKPSIPILALNTKLDGENDDTSTSIQSKCNIIPSSSTNPKRLIVSIKPPREVPEETKPDEDSEFGTLCFSIDVPVKNLDDMDSYKSSGVTLTKDYYTIPALKELDKYVDSEGACFIKGFTIGKEGFGKIYYPNSVNVSNLNLDRIIHIDYRNISIYVDDDDKPPIGEGLNCKTEVTIEQVWPIDKQSGQLIKDPDAIAKTNFIERLKLLSQKQDAVFVNYIVETGSWVFCVENV